jgi:hypothetical protein
LFQPNEVFIEDSTSNVNSERQVLCCVSIPALNPWVKQLLATDKHRPSEVRPLRRENKRAHSDESANSSETLGSSVSPPGAGVKRLCCDRDRVPRNVRCGMQPELSPADPEAIFCLVKVSSFWLVNTTLNSELKFKTIFFLINWDFCFTLEFAK